MKGPSPTARSIKWFRDRGYVVARVEQRLPIPRLGFYTTLDAFGFGDLLVARSFDRAEDGQSELAEKITSIAEHLEDRGMMALGAELAALAAQVAAEKQIALVQCTSTGNLNARVRKARGRPELTVWLSAGGKFILHGWAKRGPKGHPKRWTLTERQITPSDLSPAQDAESANGAAAPSS